jgi:hypothetical protein
VDTATKPKNAIAKVPEVLLKKRKLYADLKAKRLRSQVQATKVNHSSIHSFLILIF